MKRILRKWDRARLGRKLHGLMKRYNRAKENGYTEKQEEYYRRINELTEKINKIRD